MSATCPNCDAAVDAGQEYCGNCGEELSRRCGNCGAAVGVAANFCGECGMDLTTTGEQSGSGDEDADVWRLGRDEFARRLDGSDLGGDGLLDALTRTKRVRIEAGNRALLLEDGDLVESLGPGKHKLDSIGRRLKERSRSPNLTVVLVEAGETTLTLPFEKLRTADEDLVSATVELVARITDPQEFFGSMMADRDVLTTGAFRQELGRAIGDEVEAVVAERAADDLYGNREIKRELLAECEQRCRPALERRGLELVDLLSFDYSDGREEIREERKELDVREDREELKDEEARLDRRERERETEDAVHETRQELREESTAKAADHELEKQEVEQEHEIDDKRRRHRHEAERETVDHEEEKKRRRKEGEVDRRDLEHEQDVKELEDLVDVKRKKDQQKLDRKEREQDIEMTREEHEVEMEKERLDARDDVDAETLASLDDTDEEMADLARMDKAEDLSPEQLDALGARESDELAKARQEAKRAEKERERVEDQKEFREEMKDVMEGSMDRMERTTETAMDNMGDTAEAAAEDTSDNVIVSGEGGGSSGGDTTIVQGGGGGGPSGGESDGGGTSRTNGGADGDAGDPCPECGAAVSDEAFCTNCGADL